jgi:putative phosphoribosyl transferase
VAAVGDTTVGVRADGVTLTAVLTVPPRAPAVVVFAHSSGSGDVPPRLRDLPVGCFGASTGAAAALIAAAERPDRVRAVVSRGGRPDLAGRVLSRVTAPTLLIVGANDPEVIRLNRLALQRLGGEARLEIVPAAGHLFEEPGALERVAVLTRDWFARHLTGGEPG